RGLLLLQVAAESKLGRRSAPRHACNSSRDASGALSADASAAPSSTRHALEQTGCDRSFRGTRAALCFQSFDAANSRSAAATSPPRAGAPRCAEAMGSLQAYSVSDAKRAATRVY